MTWLLGLLGAVPRSVIFGAVGLVAGAAALWAVHHHGYSQGRQEGREAALRQSVETLRERKLTDEKVQDMDAAGLCAALGGRLLDGQCQ